MISKSCANKIIIQLIKIHGKDHTSRIKSGVTQAGIKWEKKDGSEKEFYEFCISNFISEKAKLEKTYLSFEKNLEIILGNFHIIRRKMKWPVDVMVNAVLPIDWQFSEYSPYSHLQEDLFENKSAFTALLNFPVYTLREKLKNGLKWSRKKWAEIRLAEIFNSRVPSEINKKIDQANVEADNYINSYNISMHNIIDPNGNSIFDEKLVLISHWGLRDHLKDLYENNDTVKQEIIYLIMDRIIKQEIPEIIINNSEARWEPVKNKVFIRNKEYSSKPENNIRYKKLLNIFKSQTLADKYYPKDPTLIDRSFNLNRELLQKDTERLFISVLTSDTLKKISKILEIRLKRKLKPFDIWYDRFKNKKPVNNETLEKIINEKYPTAESFKKDIPNLLIKLGFGKETAEFIASKTNVDPARGAGHAMGAKMRNDSAHLRTRITESGFNKESFNTACHELGHTTEQVMSLNMIDHYFLHGTPNTAFTEAFAFIFQDKETKLLGINPADNADDLKPLQSLWSAFEICGVGYLDIKIWEWLYKHKNTNERELKKAVIKLAVEIWNKYFYPVIGVKDSCILAIYSHIIDCTLYTPDYPLGHIIEFQIEEYLKKKNLPDEMERMCRLGNITPEIWMKKALNSRISAEPLIKAAQLALKSYNEKI